MLRPECALRCTAQGLCELRPNLKLVDNGTSTPKICISEDAISKGVFCKIAAPKIAFTQNELSTSANAIQREVR